MAGHICLHPVLHESLTGYAFLKAAVGCVLLSVSSGPMGVFLVLRRMTLIGDALSHGLFPGIATGFLLFGPSLVAMSVFGVLAGVVLALLTAWASQKTTLTDDALFSGFSLLSIALGMFLLHEDQDEFMHILFGSLASLSDGLLGSMLIVNLVTLFFLSYCYRPLVMSSFDVLFFKQRGHNETRLKMFFIMILTLNLMLSFQALGTLMALGFMVLPALIMRLVTADLRIMCIGSSLLSLCTSLTSLGIGSHKPSMCGPLMVMMLGVLYIIAILYGHHLKPFLVRKKIKR